jgi:hypothetical protein
MENGIVGLLTVTLPLGPAYVSDEISPSPVTLAIYVTLTTVPLPSVNSVGPIDKGGLQFVRPPGPLLLDPHPTATTAMATAAMLRLTFALFIKGGARVMMRPTNSGREPTKRSRTRQPNTAVMLLAVCSPLSPHLNDIRLP